jgi:hypothetical protein
MNLEPHRLQGIQGMLDDTLGWQLPDEEWPGVRAVVDRLAEALAHDDPAGLDQAREALVRCDPRRRIVKARPKSTPMPDDLRERRNMVVHEIVVRLPPDRPDKAARNE